MFWSICFLVALSWLLATIGKAIINHDDGK